MKENHNSERKQNHVLGRALILLIIIPNLSRLPSPFPSGACKKFPRNEVRPEVIKTLAGPDEQRGFAGFTSLDERRAGRCRSRWATGWALMTSVCHAASVGLQLTSAMPVTSVCLQYLLAYTTCLSATNICNTCLPDTSTCLPATPDFLLHLLACLLHLIACDICLPITSTVTVSTISTESDG